jgi:23S rRNA 5-hydroxycytidine C2501 synthase
MTIPLELLAPAGNADIAIAAINHGADAVYIGAPKFSARAEAGNSIDEIARLVRHAHPYYARVYVALNTILTDEELPQAVEIIKKVYDSGADGLIIQDTGLLETDIPPIPLIASTQMHNDTVEKIQFLEAVGFKRVILPRELSLEDIAAIRQKTKLELEAFVHGALCVSYSGQCYMSQAIKGRSANRGICAQPCRYRYDLIDGEGNIILRDKYLLSLKDLNLSDAVGELIAAGVTSFKIEGRYKETDYVKNITALYSMALDKFIKANPGYRRSSSGKSEHLFSPDAARTFNRGYTKYFLYGGDKKVASLDTQKSTGQSIGTVTEVTGEYFKTGCDSLSNGDGLCFFNKQNQLCGFRVDRAEQGRIYPNNMKGLEKGTFLYRNYDIAFDRLLKKTSAHRRIEVKMDFVQEDDRINLTVLDEDGNRAENRMLVPYENPRDTSKALEQIKKQLLRTGDTIYQVTQLNISPNQPGFLVISALNNLRRECLNELTKVRLEKYPRKDSVFVPNNVQYPIKKLDFHANVLNDNARRFYARHGAEVLESAFETLPDVRGRVLCSSRYCIRRQLDACLKSDKPRHRLKEPLWIRDERYIYLLEFDCQNCRMSVIFEGEFKT